jgi:hypothetical protein
VIPLKRDINDMSNPNLSQYGKRFSTSNQPKNNGRKPSQLRKLFKENNVSIGDQVLIFQNIIIKYSSDELKAMIQTGHYPDGKPINGLIWGFIIAWIADCKRGMSAGGIFAQMNDRKYGPVKQKLEVSGALDITTKTREERAERIKELERKQHERKPEGDGKE